MTEQHIMVDIETLGTGEGGSIISIGACEFDPNTGVIGEKFYERIAVSDWDKREIDGDTVAWWLKQSEKARAALFHPNARTMEVTLAHLNGFVLSRGGYNLGGIWSNGSDFDLVLLQDAYKKSSFGKAPWSYHQHRDMRTIRELALRHPLTCELPKNDLAHDALADAVYQAEMVSIFWQMLSPKEGS